jgi:uncharacterized iron-regulated membrane protein
MTIRSALQVWWRRPQKAPLRRALLQVHLWLALLLGVYVLVISVSGSAVVFRRELNQWLVPRTVLSTEGVRLSGEDLRRAAEAVYAGYRIVRINEQTAPNRPVYVTLERSGTEHDRLFDPYASVDLGHSYPPVLRAVEWLVDLHDNLLAGELGRTVNGIGGALFGIVVGTGLVLWWPGAGRVRQRLSPGRPAWTRAFAWRLHGVLGFWSFALLAIWAVTAVYFAFPRSFDAVMDWIDEDATDFERPGEPMLLAMIQLHFGRFGGLPVRFTYLVLGMLPAVLLVTGVIMWWTRVVRPRLESARRERVEAVFRERDADHAT